MPVGLGDSGAPWYRIIVEGKIEARGIHTGSDQNSRKAWYSAIIWVLTAFPNSFVLTEPQP